jgi:hypothetical protein
LSNQALATASKVFFAKSDPSLSEQRRAGVEKAYDRQQQQEGADYDQS